MDARPMRVEAGRPYCPTRCFEPLISDAARQVPAKLCRGMLAAAGSQLSAQKRSQATSSRMRTMRQ